MKLLLRSGPPIAGSGPSEKKKRKSPLQERPAKSDYLSAAEGLRLRLKGLIFTMDTDKQ